MVITADPIHGGVGRYEWAPDSKTLLVNAADDSAIWSFDTTTTIVSANGHDGRHLLHEAVPAADRARRS